MSGSDSTELSRPSRTAPRRRRRNSGQRWTRLLHSWLSMTGLLVVLFFAVTGLTLNHQDWTFGQSPQARTTSGTLPSATITSGEPDFLLVSEYLRANEGASGEITDHGVDGDTGRISYSGPGYTGNATFSVADGSYTMESTRYGLIAVANDLHKGRHTSTAWSWTIDVAAVVLILISLTGLILQFLIQSRRRTAMVLLGLGVVAGASLMFLA